MAMWQVNQQKTDEQEQKNKTNNWARLLSQAQLAQQMNPQTLLGLGLGKFLRTQFDDWLERYKARGDAKAGRGNLDGQVNEDLTNQLTNEYANAMMNQAINQNTQEDLRQGLMGNLSEQQPQNYSFDNMLSRYMNLPDKNPDMDFSEFNMRNYRR